MATTARTTTIGATMQQRSIINDASAKRNKTSDKKITHRYDGTSHHNIEIIQPQAGWSTLVTGKKRRAQRAGDVGAYTPQPAHISTPSAGSLAKGLGLIAYAFARTSDAITQPETSNRTGSTAKHDTTTKKSVVSKNTNISSAISVQKIQKIVNN